jgi:beta-glucanase (GH16 family)
MRRAVLIAIAMLCFGFTLNANVPAGRWRLTFSEECGGSTLDATKWVAARTDPASAEHGNQGLLSTRLPGNIVLSDGICHLITRKDDRVRGFPWTTALISTRDFSQEYGYFEARIRYNAASGLNNAFWLDAASPIPVHFEIDVNEGHYPSQVNMTLHNWAGKHTQTGASFVAHDGLSLEYHLYGLLWTPEQLTWFMDGKAIHTEPASQVRGKMRILVSTAVLPWAGTVSDTLDGTSMDIDWVHVYQNVALK